MTNYIIRRLLLNVLVLWLVATMVFLGTHALPSDFAQKRIASSMTGASQAEAIELARHELGLDKPLWRQYLDFMGELSRGDLGHSYESKLSTWTEVGRRVTTTLELGIMTLLISFAISIPIGIISAVKQNTWIDYLVTFMSTLGLTAPSFVVALWLLLLFAVRLRWLPTGGWPNGATGDWKTVIMPTVALSLGPLGIVARYTRSSLVEVIHSDYIRTARAKGLAEYVVIMRHALKNALIPLITIFGPQIPNLITGTIFVEVTFRVPGLGKFFVSSIYLRDYPMIMATMLLVAMLWSFTYLLSDILYTLVDPRVRLYGD